MFSILIVILAGLLVNYLSDVLQVTRRLSRGAGSGSHGELRNQRENFFEPGGFVKADTFHAEAGELQECQENECQGF